MLRIGILGAAKISANAIFEPVADSSEATIVAIAARDRSRAEAQAERWSIPHVEDDYDAVLARGDVDAVFIPLAISLHHELTMRSLAAGKHVLCEKPIASNADEAAEMVAAADAAGLVLMEAFHWRYHPLAARLDELVDAIGGATHIETEFSVPIPEHDEVRRSWELSGGALMDLGCYPVQWARFVARAEPTDVAAEMVPSDVAGRELVDVETTIDLTFPDGVTARIVTAMGRYEIGLTVDGPNGSFSVTNPIAPHRGHVVTSDLGGGSRQETVGGRSTYHHQLDAFVDAVVRGVAQPTGGGDSIATMRVIDAAYRAAGMPPRGTDPQS